MKKFALDKNCIIDLEENRANAVDIQKLLAVGNAEY